MIKTSMLIICLLTSTTAHAGIEKPKTLAGIDMSQLSGDSRIHEVDRRYFSFKVYALHTRKHGAEFDMWVNFFESFKNKNEYPTEMDLSLHDMIYKQGKMILQSLRRMDTHNELRKKELMDKVRSGVNVLKYNIDELKIDVGMVSENERVFDFLVFVNKYKNYVADKIELHKWGKRAEKWKNGEATEIERMKADLIYQPMVGILFALRRDKKYKAIELLPKVLNGIKEIRKVGSVFYGGSIPIKE